MSSNTLSQLIFHNHWVFIGLILLLWATVSIIIASSSSFTVGKISKVNRSRSQATRRMLLMNTYVTFLLGIFFLIYGFRDKFGATEAAATTITRAELIKTFKKCSRFREGYCLCRTYDNESTWVLIRQTDGSQLHTYTFPDELEVIGVGLFEDGVAPIIGRPDSKKEQVGEVDTLGRLTIYRK